MKRTSRIRKSVWVLGLIWVLIYTYYKQNLQFIPSLFINGLVPYNLPGRTCVCNKHKTHLLSPTAQHVEGEFQQFLPQQIHERGWPGRGSGGGGQGAGWSGGGQPSLGPLTVATLRPGSQWGRLPQGIQSAMLKECMVVTYHISHHSNHCHKEIRQVIHKRCCLCSLYPWKAYILTEVNFQTADS